MMTTRTPPGLGRHGADSPLWNRCADLHAMRVGRNGESVKFAVAGSWRDDDDALWVRVESTAYEYIDLPIDRFWRAHKGRNPRMLTIPPSQYEKVIRQIRPEEWDAINPPREPAPPIDFGASTFGGLCRLQSICVDVDSGDPLIVFAKAGSQTLYRDPELRRAYLTADDLAELQQAREDSRAIIKVTIATEV